MQQRNLGPFSVSAIGLGCMNLSHAYGTPVSAEQGERVLLSALDAGVTLFDTATLYGFGANETLVGRVMKQHRHRFTLASKCGMQGVDVNGDGKLVRVIDGRPATLRRAQAVHPIAALQTEYSLWTRNPEIAVLEACRELGVAFVAFSPVARGYLCGDLTDVSTLDAKDIRRSMPRFAPDNYAANLKLLDSYRAIATEVGCSLAQLAIAWLLHKGEHIIPIPGTTSVEHLHDDLGAAQVQLSPSVIERLQALYTPQAVVGGRYNAQSASEVDTENFAA